MTAEFQQNPEFINESELFRAQVGAIERKAAEGAYGKPLLFLAGLEVEFGVLHNDRTPLVLEWCLREKDNPDSDAGAKIKEFDLSLPEAVRLQVPSLEQSKERMDYMRQEAREFVQNLVPKNDEEREKRDAWFSDIDNFTAADLVNFTIYREFSNPTFGVTAPQKAATYAEMTEYGLRAGWMEFRFGRGILQEGYYDNEDVCELRLTPCSPTELIEREEVVMERITQVAFSVGAIVRRAGRHINLSVYSPSNEDGEWRPLIGHGSASLATTLDVAAGLTAGIEDGAWMTKEKAGDYLLFGVMGGHVKRDISPVRSSIRIVDDYVELRDEGLMASTAHGLLWTMAGITYGLEHGAAALAANGYTSPEVHRRHFVERTAYFDKERDLQLQRALEKAELLEADGQFRIDKAWNIERGYRLATTILGKEVIGDNKGAALVFNLLTLSGLYIGDEGRLFHYKGDFEAACNYFFVQEPDGAYTKAIRPLVDAVGFPSLEQAISTFLNHDALRIKNVPAIESKPRYPGLTPAEWYQRWKRSPIMQRAFGRHAEGFAKVLADEATKHYREIDLNDPVQFAAVLQDVTMRGQENR